MIKKYGMDKNICNDILEDSSMGKIDNSTFMLWKSELQKELHIQLGGVITHSIHENGVKTSYICESLLTGDVCLFARLSGGREDRNGILCGQWLILNSGMEFARQELEQALDKQVDLVVVDEFGILEKQGKGLRHVVDNVVESSTNSLIIVRTSLVSYVQQLYRDYSPNVIDIAGVEYDTSGLRDSIIYQWFATNYING